MLMDIKCSAVTSIAVTLTFDDGKEKKNIIGLGDLVSVEYNSNGMRKKVDGKVIKISAIGTDPKSWYIIVDSSDDFDGNKARFSPMNILDLTILRKADTINVVRTPIGKEGVPYLRIVKGRLQYSYDSFRWFPINIDRRDIIEPAEGTMPVNYSEPTPPPIEDGNSGDNDGIEDAVW